MKKFIVFCLILIVTVSMGVTVWYFVRDNEELVINMDPYVYKNEGDILEVDARLKNAKVGNELIITSLNPNVLAKAEGFGPNAFQAQEGGAAVIEIKVKKGNISPVYIQVSVGNGSKSAPYFIDTESQLETIGQGSFKSSSNYILMQDISLSKPFRPLINDETGFTGSFNGNGYSIKNLKIENAEGVTNAGLFAKIADSGMVSNLTISNVDINGQFDNAGAIAGENNGTITRCYVNGGLVQSTMSSGANVGGICGLVKYSNSNVGRVDRCFSDVSVMGTKNVGGLVGKNEGAIVINSYTRIENDNSVKAISDNANVGGLIGLVTYFSDTKVGNKVASVKNCYTISNVGVKDGVDKTSVKLGRIIGYNDEVADNSQNNLMGIYTDKVSNEDVLVNHKYNLYAGTLATEKVTEKTNFRGIYKEFPKDSLGKIETSKMISFVSKIETDKTKTVDWDFVNVWLEGTEDIYPVLNINGANVPDEFNMINDPKLIHNANDLREKIALINYNRDDQVKIKQAEEAANGYFKLADDFSDAEVIGEISPIGIVRPFNGTFEGNGKTLTGIVISTNVIASSKGCAGLFANTASNALIQNLTIKNITINAGASFAGAIVANNEGTIRNCVVTQDTKNTEKVNVIGQYCVGGIAGKNLGTIDNCKVINQNINSKCPVVDGKEKETAQRFIGGIAGMNGASNSSYSATIKNCSVTTSLIKDVLSKTEFDSDLDYDYKKSFSKVKYLVGGICGANFYLINYNYLFETDVVMNEFSEYGEVAGIVAYSKSDALIANNIAEISCNKLLGGNITGFIASGLVCELYGKTEFNQIGCANEYKIDVENNGIQIPYKTVIKGLEISGLAGKIYIGGKMFNCFAGSHLLNTIKSVGHSAGFCNVNEFYAYKRWFGEESVYGEFGQLFSICTFENNADTYWNRHHNRYDCTMDYRKETSFVRTDRDTGYGNNLVWVETSDCSYDDSPEMTSFNDSRQMNIKRLETLDQAKPDPLDETNMLRSVFSSYGFDSAWELKDRIYPHLTNLPIIEGVDSHDFE